MFKNLLNRVSRSRSTPQPATRRAAFESLEDRRLYSVSPVEPSSYSWGVSNPTVAVTATRLPAGQQAGGNNIIAILIG